MAVREIQTYFYKNNFSLSVVRFDKACVVNKPEQVDAYSMYWIKEGKGSYTIDFESYNFESNVLFFLSPGQVFSVDSEKIKEAYKITFVRDFYCIQTHDKEVSCNGVLFNNIYEAPFVKPCAADTVKLDFIVQSLIEEFQHEETAQYDMLQAYLKQFIVLAVRIKKEDYQLKDDTETKLFKDFSTLVDINFKKEHTVSYYAERLGLSPKSISKHFQKIGAVTPSDYLKNRLVLEAKRQLIYSNSSVKQIAYDLGFNDPAYFTRFFTKIAAVSPLQFKKDYKSN
tara:strand:+ start:97248 stop:98096 length:849 start_codon:yes stop_codon:yes gene_type:complete